MGLRTRRAGWSSSGILLVSLVATPQVTRAETSHHPINLSFFYPIATNRSPDVSSNFRLGILYGRLAAIRGVDLTAVVARTDHDFGGLQLAGVHAYTGGAFRGVALVGGVQYIGGDARGIHLAGGVNFDRGRFRGGQFAGIFNFVGGDVTGVQLTSLYNFCDEDLHGLQISSVANVTGGTLAGWQLAGLNVANDSLSGIQTGLANFVRQVEGVQIGLANFAGEMHGAQIGIWNQARRADGMMFGAVNLASENGHKGWVTSASSYTAISTGLYSGIGAWYSMLSIGVSDLEDERGDTAFLSWNYGRALFEFLPWRIDADLGFVHVMPRPSDDPAVNDRLHFALQARLLVDRSVAERWRVFAGGGVNSIWSEYSKEATPDTGPLAVLGILFE